MSGRRWLITGVVIAAAATGCNIFAPSNPEGFQGWFHLDRGPDRATSILFDNGGAFHLRSYGCINQEVLDLSWELAGSNAVVVPNLPGPPLFTPDGQGNVTSSPPIYTTDGGVETWTPGARCFLCGGADGGVYACDTPAVQDAGP